MAAFGKRVHNDLDDPMNYPTHNSTKDDLAASGRDVDLPDHSAEDPSVAEERFFGFSRELPGDRH
jgi:hypothetical protein